MPMLDFQDYLVGIGDHRPFLGLEGDRHDIREGIRRNPRAGFGALRDAIGWLRRLMLSA